MHTLLGLLCLLGGLALLSYATPFSIPGHFLCSTVHSVWCWYSHYCFLLTGVCMESFAVCWVCFLWKLRFFWFFACQLSLDYITDILNIMLGDSESYLNPVEYVGISVWSGISPMGSGHSFLPAFYGLSNPCSTIRFPPACDPPRATLGQGWRSIHSQFSGSLVQQFRVDSGTCSLRVNPAFLKQCYGVASQAPPSQWPPQTCPVPQGQTPLHCTLLATNSPWIQGHTAGGQSGFFKEHRSVSKR